MRLQQAASHCDFWASLDKALVDQLVAGVRNNKMSYKIIEANEGLILTFKNAVQLSVSVEASEHVPSYTSVSDQATADQVNYVKRKHVYTKQTHIESDLRQGRIDCVIDAILPHTWPTLAVT